MDETSVSLSDAGILAGTPVSLPHGEVIEGTLPRGITVQIISAPSVIQTSQITSQQTVTTLDKGEPGIAQTLLNIAQPEGYVTEDGTTVLHIDAEQLKALQEAGGGDDGGGQLLMVDEAEAKVKQPGDDEEERSLIQFGDKHKETEIDGQATPEDGEVDAEVKKEIDGLDEERRRVAGDIRQQIKELCAQLADLGEESFLLTVRVNDGTTEHVGSIKGDHFCLLRQELLQDFHNFCIGIEESQTEEEENNLTGLDDADDVNDTSDSVEKDKDNKTEEQNEDMEVEEPSSPADPASPPGLPTTPKVIVMRKDGSDGKVRIDHEYTVHGTNKRVSTPSFKIVEDTKKEEPTANILFLCDVCKDVFPDLKQLKDHKLTVHEEGDHHCTECSRVFTLKKNLERHLVDAHNKDGVNKFVCDSCVMDFVSKEDLEKHIAACHNPELGMKCDVCEQTFPEISKMMEHRKLHFDYDCFCSRCWQGFFDSLEMEIHIQTNCHYKEALYKCDICGKKYTKLHAINKHIDTHPIHAPHVCRMCGRGFDSEKELKNHRIAAHIVRPYKCEFCDKTFKKRESLVEHRRIHLRVKLTSMTVPNVLLNGSSVEEMEAEPLSFECSICGIILSSHWTYDQHMLGHTEGNEEHHCDHCDKVFFSRSLLIVHCRKEHKIFLTSKVGEDSELDLLACDWEGCNKTFDDRMKWKYHMKYHQNRADRVAKGLPLTPQPEECSCPICGKTLKYRSYLKLHMANHSGEKPHQCDICGTSYQSAKRLNDHIRVHKGEKPFKCRVCDKHFTSTSLRNQHMVVHWGSKTYICDICGKGFMSRKHFHDHMRIHNGEQPHKCETCGKDFIYYRSLVRHALTHIDPKERPKPYKCHYCGKEYTEVTGYKHHLRSVHTGETPFQCDICGEAFHRNDKLKRHMRSRHNRLADKAGQNVMTHIVTTRRDTRGAPVIIKTEQAMEGQQGELQIIQNDGTEGATNELHVDVIQDTQQVFLIGLGQDGGETTYLQETQVIEGPDGTRYIIAGSGEELQVIESADIQQVQEGDIIQNGEGGAIRVLEDQQVTYSADQETLATLANMASVAEIADVVQQVE